MTALTHIGPRYTRIIKDALIDAEDYDALPAAPLPHDAFEAMLGVAYLRHIGRRIIDRLTAERNEARAALATLQRSLLVGAHDAAPVPLTPDLDEESRCVHCGRPSDEDCECWTYEDAP